MKKHVILFGIFGLILGFSLQAQVLTKYTTGCESGSPMNYTLSGGNTYSRKEMSEEEARERLIKMLEDKED